MILNYEQGGVDMPILVKDIMQKFANDMRSIFGDSLCRVTIYGSYARGDYTDSSDVDVMILVKIPEEQIRDYTDEVSDCAFDYLMKYGVDISPVVKNESHFNYWVENLPYYRNVRDEGVECICTERRCGHVYEKSVESDFASGS
jgi:predicted nucleotidyltransferase